MDLKLRKFIFKYDSNELVLPVTPGSFSISHGINIETINIHTLGNVSIAGYANSSVIKINCMFPAKRYIFVQPSAVTDPYYYVDLFETLCDGRKVLRFTISDTIVNTPVLIEDVTYGEQDGTGDVYATLTLRKYRELAAVSVGSTGNSQRATPETVQTQRSYTIESGDTLSGIAQKFYGDASLYQKLADYNHIPNANLIYTDQIITIPDKSML